MVIPVNLQKKKPVFSGLTLNRKLRIAHVRKINGSREENS